MPISDSEPRVLRPDQLPAIERGGGARTIPLVTRGRGATAFLNGITEFAPGASIAHHSHNVPESVMVIEGEALVDIDGVEHRVRTHDVTFVPANTPHHFTNASATAPMKIFWTYGSLDATRTKAADGIEERIDAEQRSALGEDVHQLVSEQVELVASEGAGAALEAAVREAAPLFQASSGCRAFSLEASLDAPGHYRLTILWETLADHLDGFRNSAAFGRWRELVTPHLAEPPRAEHFAERLTRF